MHLTLLRHGYAKRGLGFAIKKFFDKVYHRFAYLCLHYVKMYLIAKVD